MASTSSSSNSPSWQCRQGHEMMPTTAEQNANKTCAICCDTAGASSAGAFGCCCCYCSVCDFGICQNCQDTLLLEKNNTNEESAAVVVVDNPQGQMTAARDLLLNAATTSSSPQEDPKVQQALSLYTQALERRRDVLGPHHVVVAETHVELGHALVPHRHYTTSMNHYRAAYNIYSEQPPPQPQDKLNQLQHKMNELRDIMVTAAQGYMMTGMDCQARHDSVGALEQFLLSHSLLDCVVTTMKMTTQTNQDEEKMTVQKQQQDDEYKTYALALADVCRILASVHVSSGNYSAALPQLEQATGILTELVGHDDERTMAMANDQKTVQGLLKKHATKSERTTIPHWFERDDYKPDIIVRMDKDKSSEKEEEHPSSSSEYTGISVHYIKTGLWKDIQAAGLDVMATMQQVTEQVVASKLKTVADQIEPMAYVAAVEKEFPKTQTQTTGPANMMLCYAANTTVADVINSLDDYCRTHNQDDTTVYVWIECLCSSVPTTTGGAEGGDYNKVAVQKRVASIQHVLAVLTPWYHPMLWSRPQCLWEIHTAHQTPHCQLTLVLPPAQALQVSDAIVGDPSAPMASLYQALDDLHVKDIPLPASSASSSEAAAKDNENAVNALELKLTLQEIFRPWVRDIVKAQVQLTSQGGGSGSTTGMESPMSTGTKSPTVTGEAQDVFHLQLSNKMGLLFWNYGEHKTALELLEDALHMTETMYGPKHEATATVYQNIANVLSDMGRYDVAIETYHKALSITEVAFPEHHPRIAETCTKLGQLYHNTNQLDKAMEYLQKALTVQVKCYGSAQTLPCAESYKQLGQVFFSKGDYDAALAECRKALGIQQGVLGEEGKNHPTLGASHSHIAMVLKAQGQYHAALEEHKKALAIYETTYGNMHIETATTYDHIVAVMRLIVQHGNDGGDHGTDVDMDRDQQALEYCEKSKTIYETILGPQHPTTAQAYHTLGQIHNDMDHVEEALENYKKALEIRKVALGEQHPTTAASLQSLGTLHYEVGNLDDALEELRKAFDVLEPYLGIEHPTTKQLAETINAVLEA